MMRSWCSLFTIVLVATLLVGCATTSIDTATADSDADGVSDANDACPNTPTGVPVDTGGCPRYSDADSVADYLDECPATPAGIEVDALGCPVDSDDDGVRDSVDDCTGTPRGTVVDDRGCPAAGERIAIITNINFDFDNDLVCDDLANRLSRVINILKENPDVTVRIVGYTDDVGSARYNQDLSLRRAESIRDYIVLRGVSISRLSVAGEGESKPLVSNQTWQGRAVNRRVEFEVTN